MSHRIENGHPHGDLVVIDAKGSHQLIKLENAYGESIAFWLEADDQKPASPE
jgi:hypothetical protein